MALLKTLIAAVVAIFLMMLLLATDIFLLRVFAGVVLAIVLIRLTVKLVRNI